MKKAISILSVFALIAVLFSACGVSPAVPQVSEDASLTDAASAIPGGTSTTGESDASISKKNDVKLGMLAGPSGLGATYLLSQNEAGAAKNNYISAVESDPTVFTASLLNGDVDIAAIPTNVAATLYAKSKGKVQILAVSTLGVLYILDRSSGVSDVASLKGKTILSSGQGTTTEYSLSYILKENGLTLGEEGSGADVTVKYVPDHAQVITLTQAEGSKYDIVLLPEPFVSKLKSVDSSFRTAIDITSEWEKLGNGALTMGCVAVRTAYAKENPQAIADFLEDYRKSIEYVNANPAESAALAEKYGILAAAVAQKAIPNCNIVYMVGEEMKTAASGFLQVLFNSSASSVGGAMPDDNFWYIEE